MSRQILYFGDPMCSWCWGFSPVLMAIDAAFAAATPVSLIVGGLHTGDATPMSDETKATIRHHWEQVNEATGQPFSFGFFDWQGFVLDTEPACRAAVTMRGLKPEATLPFYESIHHAFYVDNKDTTKAEVFAELAGAAGVDGDTFVKAFHSPPVVEETRNDFRFSRQLGVTGFPTVVLKSAAGMALLTAGYRPFEALEPAIKTWLATA